MPILNIQELIADYASVEDIVVLPAERAKWLSNNSEQNILAEEYSKGLIETNFSAIHTGKVDTSLWQRLVTENNNGKVDLGSYQLLAHKKTGEHSHLSSYGMLTLSEELNAGNADSLVCDVTKNNNIEVKDSLGLNLNAFLIYSPSSKDLYQSFIAFKKELDPKVCYTLELYSYENYDLRKLEYTLAPDHPYINKKEVEEKVASTRPLTRWHLEKIGVASEISKKGSVYCQVQSPKKYVLSDTDSRGHTIHVAVIDRYFDEAIKDIIDKDRSGYLPPYGPIGKVDDEPSFFQGGSHGTDCAFLLGGPMSADTLGNSGVAPECTMSVIKIDFTSEVPYQWCLAKAIIHTCRPNQDWVFTGARVISCSVRELNDNPQYMGEPLTRLLNFIHAGFDKCNARAPLIFISPINKQRDKQREDKLLNHPATVGTGSIDRTNKLIFNAPNVNIEFVAPGHDVEINYQGKVQFLEGNSFSTPLAAGVATLILSHRCDLSAKQVLRVMQASCCKIGAASSYTNGRSEKYGYGLLNAYQALALLDTENGLERAMKGESFPFDE